MSDSLILVVDDDPAVRQVLGFRLRQYGYEVQCAEDGTVGLELAYNTNPSLIVLDIMLPRRNGIDVLRTLRQTTLTPVVMLTAKTDIADRFEALEAGADDYMVKPFSPRELEQRVQAILAEPGSGVPLPDAIAFGGDWVFDLNRRWIRRGDHISRLTTMEFKLLCHLVTHPNRPFSRSELLHKVWGYRVAQYTDTRVVDVHARRLRMKLGDDALIAAYPGIGYVFAPSDALADLELAGNGRF